MSTLQLSSFQFIREPWRLRCWFQFSHLSGSHQARGTNNHFMAELRGAYIHVVLCFKGVNLAHKMLSFKSFWERRVGLILIFIFQNKFMAAKHYRRILTVSLSIYHLLIWEVILERGPSYGASYVVIYCRGYLLCDSYPHWLYLTIKDYSIRVCVLDLIGRNRLSMFYFFYLWFSKLSLYYTFPWRDISSFMGLK